jgi:regulation of enolase protein 1 (concanavalin A-like superfamily)
MSVAIPGLAPLEWTGVPGRASYRDGILELEASAGVDWIIPAAGGPVQQDATALAFAAPAEFSLSARVTVASPRSTYDAGVLAIWADPSHWAKLCFEFSPQGRPMVVSVVTNDVSDDVNSATVSNESVYLRIIRTGPAWAFHSSSDGQSWDFVRVFRLDTALPIRAGFLAQAPRGERCQARFDEISATTGIPRDLRDGS